MIIVVIITQQARITYSSDERMKKFSSKKKSFSSRKQVQHAQSIEKCEKESFCI